MNKNLIQLFNKTENTSSYIEELVKKEYVHLLFSLNSNATIEEEKKDIDTSTCASAQFGFTWIMTGQKSKNDKIECITIGQAQKNRVNKEIQTIYNALMGKYGEDNQYYKIHTIYREIAVYQVDIDSFLNAAWDSDKIPLKDLAYDLVKDYFAEVLLAHNTAAEYWNYYGSGMDKRFLFYLVEKYNEEFHCNRIKGDA